MGSLFEKSLFLFFSAVLISSAMGVDYKVGDDAGWALQTKVNYPKWAASKTFQVGDTINFAYDRQYQNVVEVTHPNYRACNAKNPISTYTTGNDTITIKKAGHFFYICGIPGHCEHGQKVDIRVVSGPPAAPVPSSVPAVTPPSHETPAPAPSTASIPSTVGLFSKLAMALGFFAVLAH